MSKILVSLRVEKEVMEDLRKEKVNFSEIARKAFLAERAKVQLKEFEEKMLKAAAAAKKLSNVSQTIREYREAR